MDELSFLLISYASLVIGASFSLLSFVFLANMRIRRIQSRESTASRWYQEVGNKILDSSYGRLTELLLVLLSIILFVVGIFCVQSNPIYDNLKITFLIGIIFSIILYVISYLLERRMKSIHSV